MSSVSFYNADNKFKLKDKKRIKQFIPILFSEYGIMFESVKIVLCSDEYLLSLNRQFLQHDYFTDILTFDLSTSQAITGEIYISTERVKENACEANVSFQVELLRVIFHGVLHLCGFRDKTSVQKKKMTQSENDMLIKFEEFHVKQ